MIKFPFKGNSLIPVGQNNVVNTLEDPAMSASFDLHHLPVFHFTESAMRLFERAS